MNESDLLPFDVEAAKKGAKVMAYDSTFKCWEDVVSSTWIADSNQDYSVLTFEESSGETYWSQKGAHDLRIVKTSKTFSIIMRHEGDGRGLHCLEHDADGHLIISDKSTEVIRTFKEEYPA